MSSGPWTSKPIAPRCPAHNGTYSCSLRKGHKSKMHVSKPVGPGNGLRTGNIGYWTNDTDLKIRKA